MRKSRLPISCIIGGPVDRIYHHRLIFLLGCNKGIDFKFSVVSCLVLLSPKTPLVGEKWDYQDQQGFKSLLHSSLQCGDHMQS